MWRRCGPGRLGRLLLVNTLVGLGVTIVYLVFDRRESEPWLLAVSCILVSCAIGIPGQIVLRELGRRLWRLPPWKQYGVMAMAAAGFGLLGAALGAWPIMRLYHVEMSHYLTVAGSIAKVAVTTTVTISMVALSMGRMHGQLERERAERARAEKLASEAQLASLESRVHPHFLFNTLNSISALIPESPARAEKMVEQIAGLLRQSLDAGPSTLVPVSRELKLVRDYLEIEQARFGARLIFQLHAAAEVMEVLVPAFALQVLVENSVKYAVSPRRAGGRIEVEAGAEGGRLVLRVSDDGDGFGMGDLKAGHGLDTLAARMRTLYGETAALEISSGPGASVTLRLPMRREVAAA